MVKNLLTFIALRLFAVSYEVASAQVWGRPKTIIESLRFTTAN